MLARRLPFHYAWVIVVAVGLAGALNADIRLAFGVLINPLVEEHGWSVGSISLAYTISFISMAVAGLTSAPSLTVGVHPSPCSSAAVW